MHQENIPDGQSLKRIFICASWHGAIMSLAYLDSVGESNPSHFFFLSESTRSSGTPQFVETSKMLTLFGHHVVDWADAESNDYDEVHLVPGYGMFSDDKAKLSTISRKRLIVHSDSVRNGLYVDYPLAPDVTEVVHYGFRLIEKALLSTHLPRGLVENSHVVPFESISIIWQKINKQLGDSQKFPLTTNEDILVCERYWGVAHYAISDKLDFDSYFDSILRQAEGRYKRIIFKPTSFHGPAPLRWGPEIKEYARKRKIEFVTWSQFSSDVSSTEILDHPEARFFLGDFAGLGGLFAFDGTLSVLFASLGKNTRVHWADQSDSESLFRDKRMTDLISEQGKWMRSVANQDADLDLKSSLGDYETEGSIYKSIITELYLQQSREAINDLKNQLTDKDAQLADKDAQLAGKDAQLADKDAQLADKDAQLADKDAQLADKDAQLASVFRTVSWEVTKPLRFLRKLLAKIRNPAP